MSVQNPKQSHVSHDAIETVTGRTFQRTVPEGGGPVVVEFMSYGCAHCGVMEPVLQRGAAELRGAETVVRVNVGVDVDLARRYEIAGTPTVVMFLDGQEMGRVEGPAPTEDSLMAVVTQPFAT